MVYKGTELIADTFQSNCTDKRMSVPKVCVDGEMEINWVTLAAGSCNTRPRHLWVPADTGTWDGNWYQAIMRTV
jgi:hypothetical protein